MLEKTCLVCGERAIQHVNSFDRLCTVCGIVSVGDHPAPMMFVGDVEDYFDEVFGEVERTYEPDHHGMRPTK